MCRLLGIAGPPVAGSGASADPLPSWEHLVGAPHSLRQQASDGAVPPGTDPGHHDSWGLGWFDDAGQLSLLRQTGSAKDSAYYVFASEAAARDAAGSGPARVLIGHLRKASVGAVTSENAHPIRIDPRDGEGTEPLLLAHNGTLRDILLDTLRADLRAVGRAEASADNDTIVLAAWLFIQVARSAKERGEALADALGELLRRGASDPAEAYTGINLLMAFPGEFWALRCFSKNADYYTLWRRPLDVNGGWLVASERTDDVPGWELMEPGRLTELTGSGKFFDVGQR